MNLHASPIILTILTAFLSILSPCVANPAEESLQAWQEKRFGMFIHWGPVSLKGTEIGWSRGRDVASEEYDQLYRRFNPTRFDARAWAEVARKAGMKYMVITAKHHDGFCLWPSRHTDYHIGRTPFQRDILQELAQASRDEGLQFSTYYSLCDWYHPDYPLDSPGGRQAKATSDMPRYYQYILDQTREIIDRYGPLGIMWFDGEWEKPWTREYGNELYRTLKTHQPSLIINNRVSKGRQGMAGTTQQSDLNAGDYDTPEQRVGGFNRTRPWETCMTICQQWAWKPNDTMKSLEQCLRTLLRTVGGDGNLLFNVGPMPDGRIEPRQVERLLEMGAWLERFGDGVYGTRGGPYQPGPWGASTCKDNRIFLYIMRWPGSGPLELPAMEATVRSARLPGGGTVETAQTDEGLTVHVAPPHRDGIVTVVELHVDRPSFEIDPLVVTAGRSLAFKKPARASNVYMGLAAFGADMALDGDVETRWATDAGTRTAWLEVDLGERVTVDRVVIDEPEAYARIRRFELLVQNGTTWDRFHQGTTVGPHRSIQVEPVTARRFRLNILEAIEGPTIREFQLFPPATK